MTIKNIFVYWITKCILNCHLILISQSWMKFYVESIFFRCLLFFRLNSTVIIRFFIQLICILIIFSFRLFEQYSLLILLYLLFISMISPSFCHFLILLFNSFHLYWNILHLSIDRIHSLAILLSGITIKADSALLDVFKICFILLLLYTVCLVIVVIYQFILVSKIIFLIREVIYIIEILRWVVYVNDLLMNILFYSLHLSMQNLVIWYACPKQIRVLSRCIMV